MAFEYGKDVRIAIKVDDHGAIAALDGFPAVKDQILMRALNRTADWAKNKTLDVITASLAIKRSDLDGNHRFGGVKVMKAKPDRLQARVTITGARVPLFRFRGKPTEPAQPPPKSGISYQIDAGGGRKRLRSNAFVAQMASGHIGFFQRITDKPDRRRIQAKTGKRAGKWITSQHIIRELHGPSIPHVAELQPSFKSMINVDAGARLELELQRQTAFVMTGTSKLPGGE